MSESAVHVELEFRVNERGILELTEQAIWLANVPNNVEGREALRVVARAHFEQRLSAALERLWAP